MKPDDFLFADWPAADDIVAGTSLRTGGVSSGAYASLNLGAHVGDDPVAVAENRARVAGLLGFEAAPAWLRQVHGSRVVEVSQTGSEPEADAAWTDRPGTICVVMTADCLPVLFSSRDGGLVAAAHAGWRGLAQGVLEATVAALPCDPAELLAWMGPAIAQPAFEVGDEVRQAFVAADPDAASCFTANARGRWQADLY